MLVPLEQYTSEEQMMLWEFRMEQYTSVEHPIFRVPELLKEPNREFYTPTTVGIGPYQWEKPGLAKAKKNRIAAYIRMFFRMRKNFPDDEQMRSFTLDILSKGEALSSVYNLYAAACFGEETFPLELNVGVGVDTKILRIGDFDVLHHVLISFVIDACFIFEFLLNYLRRMKENEKYLEEWAVRWPNDNIFDSWVQNPTWQGIVNDLLMLENQLPLSCLTFLSEMCEERPLPRPGSGVGAKESIIQMMWEFANLNHGGIFTWPSPCSTIPEESSHLLDMFYKRIVGSDLKCYQEDGYPWEESQCFLSMPSWFKDLVVKCKDVSARFLTQCSSSVRGFFPYSKPMDGEGSESRPGLQIPSAAELSKMGVKFHAVRQPSRMNATPIRYIRFDERKSALYLPEVRVDRSAQILLMNFIALEVTSAKYHPRPMTNFALFMDELINSEDDVGVLRRAGIFRNLVSTDAELAHNFNGLRTGLAFNEGFKVVDQARLGLRKFLKRRYKILWNEFLTTYFSKPWLFLGAVGAVLLLFMTVAQVLCLFYNCNPSQRKLYG